MLLYLLLVHGCSLILAGPPAAAGGGLCCCWLSSIMAAAISHSVSSQPPYCQEASCYHDMEGVGSTMMEELEFIGPDHQEPPADGGKEPPWS